MKTTDRPTIIHVLHSVEGGGTEGRTLVALLRGFDRCSLAHAVVPLRQAGSLSAHLPDHVACRPIEIRGRSLLAGLKLARIVRRLRASVIHARNTGCWHDATLAHLLCPRTHLVLGFHGLQSSSPFNRRQRLKARFALHTGARFTTVSESGRRQLHRQIGIPPERITVLSNGIDLELFENPQPTEREAARREFHLTDADCVVGTVGSLVPVKRHEALIEAFARLSSSRPSWRLLIVGDGPLRSKLEREAADLGIRRQVRFVGRREDVPRCLASMDLFVCSSSSEGMSNALLEAMAGGLPVVATDVGDNATVLRDGIEGRIIPAPGSVCLASAIKELGIHLI